MKELIAPFYLKKDRIKILYCTLIFISAAIPFKVMVLVEGLTEVRPVSAVPIVVGLLLGPIGAWGCALGNLIADFFGTFSKFSIMGYIGNFIAAYLPYQLWKILNPKEFPNTKRLKNVFLYIFIAFLTSLSTAMVIIFGNYYIFNFWSREVFFIIFFNNFFFSVFIGLPVLIVLTSEEVKFSFWDFKQSNKYYNKEQTKKIYFFFGDSMLLLFIIIYNNTIYDFLVLTFFILLVNIIVLKKGECR